MLENRLAPEGICHRADRHESPRAFLVFRWRAGARLGGVGVVAFIDLMRRHPKIQKALADLITRGLTVALHEFTTIVHGLTDTYLKTF